MLACLFGVPNKRNFIRIFWIQRLSREHYMYIDCMILRTRVMFALRAPRRHIGVTTLALTENDQ